MAHDSTSSSRSSTGRRLAARTALVLVAVAFAGSVYVWRLTRLPPTWWAPPAAGDPQIAALAETVEYRLTEVAHEVRPADQPWRVRIREEQVNAWLSARLPEWLAHTGEAEWPDGVGVPQIHFQEDALAVAVGVEIDGRRRFLSCTLRPEIVDGQLQLSLDSVALGRVWLPGGSAHTVARELREMLPGGMLDDPRVDQIMDLLGGGQYIDPAIDLADGRRLRLRGIEFTEGELVVEAETGRDAHR